jgi:2-oxoglutarate decarboxylase
MVAGTTTQVVMPTMGDSVTEGTILEWHKAEGDHVTADETLVEISTDKVDAEVAAPVAGTVVKIHAAEGDTVGVGALLAEIATNGDAPAAGNGAPADAPAATTIDIVTPAAGESVTEGTILDWTVAVGDVVSAGDTVVEISTDKVDVELPAPAAGTITELLAASGDTVTVGQVIGRMSSTVSVNGDTSAPAQPTEPAPKQPTEASTGDSAKATPVARRTAEALNVDLGSLAGSGPSGRILKADVLAAADGAQPAADGAQPAPAAASELRGGAAMLARYMDESRSLPTATSFRTIVVTALEGRRGALKEAGARVSYTHLIAYAIARAAAELGVMADHYEEIDGKPHRVHDEAVNLGLAVDVAKKDGSRTLMVPVIRDAAALGFADFLAAYDALVEKARTNTLGADDLVGANLTLTNPGGLGTVASVPRLMPGQGTIVATGSIAYPVGLGEIAEQIGAEKVMTLTSTYDHRVIQGAQSGQFLARIDALLAGADGFYEDVFGALAIPLAPLPARRAPAPAAATGAAPGEELLQAAASANSLVRSLRTHGHLAASLDPLGSPPQGDPALDPQSIGLTTMLMAQIPSKLLHIFVPGETLAEAFPRLREVYCGTIAYQLEHIASHQQRRWLREKIEGGVFRQPLSAEEQRALLTRLIEVDALERFMHRSYLGQHQFSIEGIDMTVPMLDEMIRLSAGGGAREVVIGMAHRGRLNVLAHNLGRPYEMIFAEFEGASTLEAVTTIPQGGTGDVKYHHGAQGSYTLADGATIQVNLESNPSHLEYVGPVVMGATRAAQSTYEGARAARDTTGAVPIMIHGDASFPGQGVVAETLNLQTLDGYTVGGTLHLITNNQTGFTTDPDDARSTHWASDLAKGFDIPIVHVNADDVEACIAAVRLAFAYREKWGHDVLIDLIGYRRFGHNESDEPAYTQPEMYSVIAGKKRVWELWADELISRKVITPAEVDQARDEAWEQLTSRHEQLQEQIAALRESGNDEPHTEEYHLDRSASPEVDTNVDAALLREIDGNLTRVPAGFTVHPKLARQIERRRGALDGAIDWAHAEALAYGSLLAEGTPIRLTGQDTERGTFSQRHLVLHDATNGQTVCPIGQLPSSHAPFELHNSPLSEVGCLGFEYGYSQESPETLVLWEAQFGDFVNAAQVIVDQFIVSGLAKWGQTSRLTLLLPHGYEGSGPEHSSARLERFLSLAAEGNLRVAHPTTPAQYFHLLRRQARIVKQRPLIVMTPKSLLRLPQATSSLEELADGRFEPVLAEPVADESKVTRLILCTGKIYYDLVGHPDRAGKEAIAVGRVELLYPFPENELLETIARYPNLTELAWVQEEPRNMGARAYMSPRLLQIIPAELEYGYIGRPERASPGEGYPAAHAIEQSRIVRTALDGSVALSQYPVKTPGER